MFAQASCYAVEENYEEALKLFLEIVKKDRNYKNDGARKAMVSIFTLLGESNPLTKEYRKNLQCGYTNEKIALFLIIFIVNFLLQRI
jgi:Thioredoxin domain-containing protein